jgi:hypothetical protein
MATTPEELSMAFSEGDEEVVKELDKVILSRGAWTTILYRYQELERAKGQMSGDKYSIRRYQKRNGEYQQKSKFNISSRDQAQAIVEALNGWLAESD